MTSTSTWNEPLRRRSAHHHDCPDYNAAHVGAEGSASRCECSLLASPPPRSLSRRSCSYPRPNPRSNHVVAPAAGPRSDRAPATTPIADEQPLPIPNGPVSTRFLEFLTPIMRDDAVPLGVSEVTGAKGAHARYRIEGAELQIHLQASTYPGNHPATVLG